MQEKGRRSRDKIINADDDFIWHGHGFNYDSRIWDIRSIETKYRYIQKGRKYMYGIKELWKDESGMGTVEVILIIVVLIGLVLIFKKQITQVVNNIFDKIVKQSNSI